MEFAAQLDGVGILADIYWVAAGGIDLPGTLTELGPQVRRLHVKDGHLKPGPIDITEPMTAVGDGKVDIAGAIAAAPQVDWHVAELDEYDGDPFEALSRSYDFLVGKGLSRGRSS
jgi:sugar phosphate isomerase/epimerase